MHKKYTSFIFIGSCFVCMAFILFIGIAYFKQHAYATTADDLQQQINSHTSTIQQLQNEINQYQAELNKTSVQAKSLQGAIQTLELNSKKLQANLALTQNKIDATNLKIQQLSLGITDKQSHITNDHKALQETIKNLNETDGQSLLTGLLLYRDLSEFWQQFETLQRVQAGVQNNVDDLKNLKKGLETNKSQTEYERTTLVQLKTDLNDQQTSVELNKKQQTQLLALTKDKESNYQKLIADKQAKEKAFEKELTQFEAQLKLIIDPNSIPTAHSGILAWPLTSHIITQYFGNTDFSAAHSQLYSGKGHNGIDIAAAIGTPLKAALDGVIKGTGDTDTACPGASFGKWVLIEHPNGLSTLYAHLSLIKAVPGQHVLTGDTIGYSGMTGYATGPHLHFTVYATQGVQILSRKSAACSGATYVMPIATLQGYLNPLSFL